YSPGLGAANFNSITGNGDAGIIFGTFAGLNTVDYGFVIAPHRGNNSGLRITSNGDVGIGVGAPDSKLSVKGGIHAQEVKLDLTGAAAPDYVFAADYKLPALAEVAAYIRKNSH